MKQIASYFYILAALSALCGMAWGIQMSASGDHILSPAHGHLNLLGFVAMAVFGTYYALCPAAAQSRIATVHLVLAVLSVVVLIPGIVFAITGQGEVLAKIGSILAIVSMLIFTFVVAKHRIPA